MADRRVRIYPTGTAYIDGVPAVEMLLEPDDAAELLRWNPPAFTTTRPADQPEPSPDPVEVPPPLPVAEPPAPPSGEPAEPGESV